jgi:transcriptional regulator with XRE-family HTH domain
MQIKGKNTPFFSMNKSTNMTPFGEHLVRVLRVRQITQTLLARNMQMHHSYLSAILHGRKGTPSEELVRDICVVLELDPDEQRLLERAAHASFARVRLPEIANFEERELVGQLVGQIGKLEPAQIIAMKSVLQLTPSIASPQAK